MALTALEKIKVTGQLTAALGELNAASNAIAKVKAAKAVTELLARLGFNSFSQSGKVRTIRAWHGVKRENIDMYISGGKVILSPKFDGFSTDYKIEPGIWFSTDKKYAAKYGEPIEFILTIENPIRHEAALKSVPNDNDAVYRMGGKGDDIENALEIAVFDPSKIKLANPVPDGSVKINSYNSGGDNAVKSAQPEPEKIRNFGWDSAKLADLTYDQLDTLRKQVESEHVNPKDSEGRYVENGKRTIYVYDAKGRKKLDALSWAVTHKLKDDKKSSAEPQPVTAQPEVEPQQAPAPASLAEVASNPEPEQPEQPQHQIIEYTTKRGKVLRGVIRTDLTYAQAKAIDEYTWKMNGGWFIRERHIADLPASAAGQPVQPVEKAVKVEPTPEELAAKELAKRQEKANKLLEAGQNVIERADSVINQDRKTNTHRRASMAAGVIQREEGNRALGVTMQNIANGILDGEVKYLSGITAKAQLESLERILRLARYEREKGLSYQQQRELKDMPLDKADADNARMPQVKLRNHGQFVRVVEEKAIRGYKKFLSSAQYWGERPLSLEEYDEVVKFTDADSMVVDWVMTDNVDALKRLNKLGITNNEQLRAALNEYLSYRGEKRAENPVKKLERAIIGKKVGIDFFPTPSAQAQKMIALAGIKQGDRVLEPSAGNGNIADAAAAAGAVVDVVEISPQLQDILKAKGYNLVDTDFMNYQPEQPYDAIVMNPPFSNRLDAAHIMRAYEMVKPGGRLVAIAGEGVFFGSDKKAEEFRAWLEKVGATDEKLEANTFKDANLLATTGANARMIVIRK